MKYLQKFATLLCALSLVLGVAVSCDKEPDEPVDPENPEQPDKPDDPDDPEKPKNPAIALEILSTDQSSVTLKVVTRDLVEFAYLASKDAEKFEDPREIFEAGTYQDCTDGDMKVVVGGLEPATSYHIYFAGRIEKNNYYKTIEEVEAKTTDFDEDLTFFEITRSSFKIRASVPQSVKEGDNVLKWYVMDMATYNLQKPGYMGPVPDGDFMNLNDEYYHNYFRNDTTMTISNEDAIIYDENGNPVDDEMGGYLAYYGPVIPGQPHVVLLGEFAYSKDDHWGWGNGYYDYLFDLNAWFLAATDAGYENVNEADYWSGYYRKEIVSTLPPEKLNAKLNITTDVRPNGGVVRVTPDENVYQYCICVWDMLVYNQVMSLLGGNEDLLQWYVTSMNAYQIAGGQIGMGEMEFHLEDIFFDLFPGQEYYVFVTGMSDEFGTAQCFEKMTFTLPTATKPAPKVEVRAIENPNGENPYQVYFNIKSTTGDVKAARYVANYSDAWDAMLKNYTYNQLVDAYGVPFSEASIAKINSPEGLDVNFTSYPRYVTRLVVGGENDEGTVEDLSLPDCKAIGEAQAPALDNSGMIESPLFEELKGDWTATTTVLTRGDYDPSTGEYEYVTKSLQSRVRIGESECPDVLPEDVYAIYARGGLTREQTTALYEEFKQENDIFNSEVRGQNRLLCVGFDYAESPFGGALYSATPYELFIMEDYNALNNAAIFFDFGQKWYLQIDENGKVTAPMNDQCLYPMSVWNYQEACYFAGVGMNEDQGLSVICGPDHIGDEWPAFDVTLSADKNEMILNNLDGCYPNSVYNPRVSPYVLKNTVISNVILTRGWDGEAQSASRAAMSSSLVRANDQIGIEGRPYSRASFSVLPEIVEYKQAKYHVVSLEEFQQNAEKYLKKVKASNR